MNTDILIEFTKEVRNQMLSFNPSRQEYENLSVLLRDYTEAVNRMYNTAISQSKPEEQELLKKRAEYFFAVVNESFGELLADWREGMSYEDFLDCVQEEKAIWYREIID
ncbi:hypothetical protein EOL96_03455 [Candidatus Saccharibacteria bacterium]|nr:hypothetical protein [Candidatus Saccharibacteria bacterium]